MNIDEDMELLIFNYLKNSNSFTSFLEPNTPVVSPSNLVDILTEEEQRKKEEKEEKERQKEKEEQKRKEQEEKEEQEKKEQLEKQKFTQPSSEPSEGSADEEVNEENPGEEHDPKKTPEFLSFRGEFDANSGKF